MNNGAVDYIPDGYTETIYFEAVDNLHGALRFTYRPLLITSMARINREINECGVDDEKKQRVAAKWMAQRLVSWSLKKPGGEEADCHNSAELERIRPALFNRMWNVIGLGIDGGDPDPGETESERPIREQTELAVAHGEGMKQEVLEKN